MTPEGAQPEPTILRGHDDALLLAFSPGGPWLATSDLGGTIHLWDVSGDRPSSEPRVLAGAGANSEPVFSSDGSLLATATDRGVEGWHLSSAALLERAGETVGRNFSPNEWDQHFSGEPYRPTFPHLPIPEE